jgi:hypothetical protein
LGCHADEAAAELVQGVAHAPERSGFQPHIVVEEEYLFCVRLFQEGLAVFGQASAGQVLVQVNRRTLGFKDPQHGSYWGMGPRRRPVRLVADYKAESRVLLRGEASQGHGEFGRSVAGWNEDIHGRIAYGLPRCPVY